MTTSRPQHAFTVAGYRALLEALLARGYTVRAFADAEPGAAHLILRHDLDMSLEAALPIAEIEYRLGVAAGYFVLLRSEMYNPFSAAARVVLERLLDLGHEVGLHFDAALYGDDPAALERAGAWECAVLEALLGREVRTVSFHRPAEALQGRAGAFSGRRHAYEPRFFKEMGYCSDSRGAWHHGHPLDHPAVRETRGLQLLTHPIWWIGEGSPEARLGAFLRARTARLDQELAAHCDVHKAGGTPEAPA